jgi:hypothetical protein
MLHQVSDLQQVEEFMHPKLENDLALVEMKI